jgi:hypothetical protein
VSCFGSRILSTLETLVAVALSSLSQGDIAAVKRCHKETPARLADEDEKIRRCKHVQDLVLVALPSLLNLGIMVRNCSWSRNQAPSLSVPSRILSEGIRLLLQFSDTTSGVYLREAMIALHFMHCRRGVMVSPNAWQEEPCEAMLSRLSSYNSDRHTPSHSALRRLFIAMPEAIGEHHHSAMRPNSPAVQSWLWDLLKWTRTDCDLAAWQHPGRTIRPKPKRLIACTLKGMALPTSRDVDEKLLKQSCNAAVRCLKRPCVGLPDTALVQMLDAQEDVPNELSDCEDADEKSSSSSDSSSVTSSSSSGSATTRDDESDSD